MECTSWKDVRAETVQLSATHEPKLAFDGGDFFIGQIPRPPARHVEITESSATARALM